MVGKKGIYFKWLFVIFEELKLVFFFENEWFFEIVLWFWILLFVGNWGDVVLVFYEEEVLLLFIFDFFWNDLLKNMFDKILLVVVNCFFMLFFCFLCCFLFVWSLFVDYFLNKIIEYKIENDIKIKVLKVMILIKIVIKRIDVDKNILKLIIIFRCILFLCGIVEIKIWFLVKI